MGQMPVTTTLKVDESDIAQADRPYHAAFCANPLMNVILRLRDGVILDANDAALQTLGLDRARVVGRNGSEIGLWLNSESPRELLETLERSGAVDSVNLRIRTGSGEAVALRVSAKQLVIGDDPCAIVIGEDVSVLRRAERELRLTHVATEHMLEALVTVGEDSGIEQVNPAFTRITGYSFAEAAGRTLTELLFGPSKQHDSTYLDSIDETLERAGDWQGEVWVKRKDGQMFPAWISVSAVAAEHGESRKFVVVLSDHTEQQAYKNLLRRAALYDDLTGLPNRNMLRDRLDRATRRAIRSESGFGVLYVDLDGFKPVNDRHGHASGDAVLKAVAERMIATVRDTDTVARIGGDEFVIVAEAVGEPQEVLSIANSVIDVLSAPVKVARDSLVVSASVGAAIFPEHGRDADTLLDNADSALYIAKRSGRGRCCLFDATGR